MSCCVGGFATSVFVEDGMKLCRASCLQVWVEDGSSSRVSLTMATTDSELQAMETVVMEGGAPLPGPIRVIAHAVGREKGTFVCGWETRTEYPKP
jgi:hypothetical protein